MTESEKSIREMAEIIEKRRLEARATVGSLNEGVGMWYARDLYMKGYRKKSEVAKRIRDEMSDRMKAEAEITKEAVEMIIANGLQGIIVQNGHLRPVDDCLMLQGSTWQLEFQLSITLRGCRLLRALIIADEKTNNRQMAKYHENYVRINYPEEYKKYKEGK